MATCTPDWSLWLNTTWGFPDDVIYGSLFGAQNVVFGTNPPYSIQTFFSMYTKFGGTPLAVGSAIIVLGSAAVTVPSSTGLAVGNPVAGAGIPDGAFIQSVDSGTQVTLTVLATASGTITLTAWNATTIPVLIVLTYLMLATASLVAARWQEQWIVAMGLFVAHYLTLYARADGNPLSNIGQIAAQGLSFGITVAKAVGDVSVSFQPIVDLEEFGAWNLTLYGQLLATMARVVGAGPMLLY